MPQQSTRVEVWAQAATSSQSALAGSYREAGDAFGRAAHLTARPQLRRVAVQAVDIYSVTTTQHARLWHPMVAEEESAHHTAQSPEAALEVFASRRAPLDPCEDIGFQSHGRGNVYRVRVNVEGEGVRYSRAALTFDEALTIAQTVAGRGKVATSRGGDARTITGPVDVLSRSAQFLARLNCRPEVAEALSGL